MLIQVENKNLYVEEYGKGNEKTVVYFHGGPGASCLDFINQAKRLGEWFHVISFDQYGVLRSDAIPDGLPFGMVDHVNLIDKLRENLNIDKW